MSDGSWPAPPQTRHIGALDGLRGFAVLLVFCVHAAGNAAAVVAGLDLGLASFDALATWPLRVLFWLQRSRHGVFLFFVLSGYLIGRMWWPQLQLSYAQFAWRRTLRIYPAFLLAFVASLLFVRSGGSTTRLP
jgi:peptidoglycan/LPS O-acetylase OafA/YrhL